MPTPNKLGQKIAQITSNTAGEPDLYAYIRDLLTQSAFDVGLAVQQVVIDSKLDQSLRRPYIVVYRSIGNRALRGPDYAMAVFEVKTDDRIEVGAKAVLREKQGYVQSGTQWFFLGSSLFHVGSASSMPPAMR